MCVSRLTIALPSLLLLWRIGRVSADQLDAIGMGGGLGDDGLDPTVQVMELLDRCGISTDYMDNAAALEDDPMAMLGTLSQVLDPITVKCNEAETSQFQDALDAFSNCAGFNMEEYLESFPSALVGVGIHCAPWMMKVASSVMTKILNNDENMFPGGEMQGEMMDVASMAGIIAETYAMPERQECQVATSGHNLFGTVLHDFYYYPDQMCQCMSTLHDQVPSSCTLDLWPVPLVGPWLKTTTCLLSETCTTFLDPLCSQMLSLMDGMLLPSNEGTIDEAECPSIMAPFDMMFGKDIAKHMVGKPLPDRCAMMAQTEEPFASANFVERYEDFRTKCTDHGDGWPDGDTTGTTASTTTMSSSMEKKNPDTLAKDVDTEMQSVAAEAAAPRQSLGGFLGGFAAACTLLIAFLVVSHKRNRNNRSSSSNGRYGYLDASVSVNDLEMT